MTVARSYDAVRRDSSLAALKRDVLLASLLTSVNAECCDHWADDGRVALNWVGRSFALESLTFGRMPRASGWFANVLRGLRGFRHCQINQLLGYKKRDGPTP
jgi:hypothetical protein